jgi:nucleotide-binding universal stress UspA family protein
MYNHLLIPTDGSPLSAKAVEHGAMLAKLCGATVSLITVTEPFHVFSLHADQLEDTRAEYKRHTDERATRALAQAAEAVQRAGVSVDKVHAEDDDQPYEAIVRTAVAKRCDLIVMASHGRRGVSALLLGSETTKVLTHSKIPVLVVR